jgi:hypothetical protein
MSTPISIPKSKLLAFDHSTEALIVIDRKSMDQYRYLVNKVSPNEVQWYSVVNRVIYSGSGTGRNTTPTLYEYHVSNMMIPKQEVTRSEVDTRVKDDPSTMMCILQELKERHANDSELSFDIDAVNNDIQRMHVWCHSHPFSSNPHPSGTDETTFRNWVKDNQIAQGIDSPMLMLIFGNSDKVYARVYDPRLPGTMFDTVPVHIETRKLADTSYIDEAVSTKITSRTYVSVTSGGGYWDPKSKSWTKNSKEPVTPLPRKIGKNFFQKKFPGDWDAFIDQVNKKQNNAKEVKVLWNFLTQYLVTDVQRTIFMLALTSSGTDLHAFAVGLSDDEAIVNDDCLSLFTELMGRQLACSESLAICVTFAKRYAAQVNEPGRTRAISVCNMRLATVSLPPTNLIPEFPFLEEDDDYNSFC